VVFALHRSTAVEFEQATCLRANPHAGRLISEADLEVAGTLDILRGGLLRRNRLGELRRLGTPIAQPSGPRTGARRVHAVDQVHFVYGAFRRLPFFDKAMARALPAGPRLNEFAPLGSKRAKKVDGFHYRSDHHAMSGTVSPERAISASKSGYSSRECARVSIMGRTSPLFQRAPCYGINHCRDVRFHTPGKQRFSHGKRRWRWTGADPSLARSSSSRADAWRHFSTPRT
jgi:hypothetical protein